MMEIIETKTYKVNLTIEDKKKFREVIAFLDDLERIIGLHQFMVEDPHNGEEMDCSYYDIRTVSTLLRGLEADDYIIYK